MIDSRFWNLKFQFQIVCKIQRGFLKPLENPSVCPCYDGHISRLQIYICTYIYISNPKQPAVKKVCGPQKGYGEKRCEIQGGGQEMAVMVG